MRKVIVTSVAAAALAVLVLLAAGLLGPGQETETSETSDGTAGSPDPLPEPRLAGRGEPTTDAEEQPPAPPAPAEEAARSAPPEHAGVIAGVVLDGASGIPVQGAEVVVLRGGAKGGFVSLRAAPPYGVSETDDGGRFRVEDVETGVLVTVRARAPGYGAASKSVTLDAGATTPLDVELRLPAAGTLRGTVRRVDGGPAAGAVVYAVPASAPMLLASPGGMAASGGRVWRSLPSEVAEDGSYAVEGLELGAAYFVVAILAGEGRSPVEAGVIATVEAPEPRLDLALLPLASLTVRIAFPEGVPEDSGHVVLVRDVERHVQFVEIGLRQPGVFEATIEVPGEYRLTVHCPGALVEQRTVAIEAGETKEVEIRLDRGLALAGVLVDDQGAPVAGQKIFLGRPWQEAGKHPPSEGRAETDAQGRFRIQGLRAGPHSLGLVLGKHFVPDDLRLEPPAEDLRVVVLRKASLRAQLELPPGATPPEHVGLRVTRGAGTSGHSLPWGDGRLLFHDLVPGEGQVRIQVEGYVEASRDVNLAPGEILDLGRVVLERGLDLEGQVLDRAGRPVVGAQVSAGETWTQAHRSATTDEDGRFLLGGLTRGENEVGIEAEGFLPKSDVVEAPVVPAPRTFVLDRGGLLTLRIRTARDEPVVAVDVRWRRAGTEAGDEIEGRGETDHHGVLDVRLPEGSWTLEVLDPEYRPLVSRDVAITEGGSATERIDLPR